MKRDKITRDEALAKITSQMDMDKKAKLADTIIDNSSTTENLKKEISRIKNHFKIHPFRKVVEWLIYVVPATVAYLALSLYLIILEWV
jgi:hypothetical protein